MPKLIGDLNFPFGVQIDPDGCRTNHLTLPNSCCRRAISDIGSDSSSLPICSSVSKERAISRCCLDRALSRRFAETMGSNNRSHIWLLFFSIDSLIRLKEANFSCQFLIKICSVGRRKIAKKIAKNKRCYANTLRPRSRMLLKVMKGG
jgi:hypothetical protein